MKTEKRINYESPEAASILRCWRCVVQPGKPHSKYIPIKEQQP